METPERKVEWPSEDETGVICYSVQRKYRTVMRSGGRKISIDMRYQRKGESKKHTASLSVPTSAHCSMAEGTDM
jgi:hypothetical protein